MFKKFDARIDNFSKGLEAIHRVKIRIPRSKNTVTEI